MEKELERQKQKLERLKREAAIRANRVREFRKNGRTVFDHLKEFSNIPSKRFGGGTIAFLSKLNNLWFAIQTVAKAREIALSEGAPSALLNALRNLEFQIEAVRGIDEAVQSQRERVSKLRNPNGS